MSLKALEDILEGRLDEARASIEKLDEKDGSKALLTKLLAGARKIQSLERKNPQGVEAMATLAEKYVN